MRARDVIVGGAEAWEITKLKEGGTVLVRLVAGADVSARTSEIPSSLLQGRAVYRRISVVDDVDVELAAAEVSRHVDEDKLQWYPRLWVEEFLRRYPADSPVPDSTVMLGWFSRLVDCGEARYLASQAERRRDRSVQSSASKRGARAVQLPVQKESAARKTRAATETPPAKARRTRSKK